METAGGHGSSREERLGKRYAASLSLFFLSFFLSRSFLSPNQRKANVLGPTGVETIAAHGAAQSVGGHFAGPLHSLPIHIRDVTFSEV
jgi:hypothetical protein